MLNIAAPFSSFAHIAIVDSAIAAWLAVSNPALSNCVPLVGDTAKVQKGAKTSVTGNELTGGAKPIWPALLPRRQKTLWIMLQKAF